MGVYVYLNVPAGAEGYYVPVYMELSEGELVRDLQEKLQRTEQALLNSQRECKLKDQQIEDLQQQLRLARQWKPSVSDEQQKPIVENGVKQIDKDVDLKAAKRAVKGQSATAPATIHSITRKADSPTDMRRGTAAVNCNKCYFIPWGSYHVHEYDINKNEWVSLPSPYPYRACALAVVKGLLTGIGGTDHKLEPTNELCALVEGTWSKGHYPAMPTPRAEPAVAIYCGPSASDFVVVIGGRREVPLTVVEVMDVASMQWTEVSPTPVPLKNLSASVCGDHIYVTEGVGSLAFRCQCPPVIGGNWEKVAELLMRESTSSVLCGHPLVVSKRSCDIFALAEDESRWHVIGQLSSARSYPFLVQVGWNKVLVVGGGDMEKGGSSITELVMGSVVI